jgi:hypothetical protein
MQVDSKRKAPHAALGRALFRTRTGDPLLTMRSSRTVEVRSGLSPDWSHSLVCASSGGPRSLRGGSRAGAVHGDLLEVEVPLDADGLVWPDEEWLPLFLENAEFPGDLEEPRVEHGRLRSRCATRICSVRGVRSATEWRSPTGCTRRCSCRAIGAHNAAKTCPLAARGRVGRTRRRLLSSPSLCVHTMAAHRWRAGGARRRKSSTPPAEPLSAYEEVEPGT